jgi:hypothetical protein
VEIIDIGNVTDPVSVCEKSLILAPLKDELLDFRLATDFVKASGLVAMWTCFVRSNGFHFGNGHPEVIAAPMIVNP